MLNAQGELGSGPPSSRSQTPQADATAVVVGDYLWLYGGSDAKARSARSSAAYSARRPRKDCPRTPTKARSIRWDVNNAANLPVARTNASGWGANGALYLAGGNDGSGPKSRGLLGDPDDRPAT